jgi:probable phosphoglycerate mutase
MLEIVLIRPGSTDYDSTGRIQGTLDIPLNAEGNSEVAREIEQLRDRKIEAIYCSTCQPALQTASAIAAALDAPLKKLDNMRNLDHGLWQGMLVDEVKRKHPRVYRQWQEQPDSICPPEGETIGEARQRVTAAIKKLFKKHKQGVIGLVVPEPLASIVAQELGRGNIGDLWKAGEKHGCWESVGVEPQSMVHAR